MAKKTVLPPRVFVSYSWSSEDHQRWVIELAERLRGDGVDVVLDKWDLREGQDKYAFMEQMVSNPDVNKVLVISDYRYAEKADNREGGVGAESQIISKEVYERTDQTKFVAIVAEVDSDGKPYLPTFLRARIYIDMSGPEKYNDNYPKLVRCIFDKPPYEKPPLGVPPSYITDDALMPSKTRGKLEMVKDAIINDKQRLVTAFVTDYTVNWSNSLPELRVEWNRDEELDESTVASIRKSLALRDEFIEFLQIVSKFSVDSEIYEHIGETYQGLLKLYQKPDDVTAWFPKIADNFYFLVYELFLYLTAILVQCKRLTELDKLLARTYFDPTLRTATHPNGSFAGFPVFNRPCETLDNDRMKRLGLRRLSVTADIIKERATRRDVSFDLLMQADLILFLRSILHPRHNEKRWIPKCLVFGESGRPFEFFARAASKRYFGQVTRALGVLSKDELMEKFLAAGKRGEAGVDWLYRNLDIPSVANFERLDTEP